MHKALWVVQVLVALGLGMAGAMKLMTPYAELVTKMPWATDFSAMSVKLIAGAEVLGALGLILPSALRIKPVLTPVAAGCLALLMCGAAVTHLGRGEHGGMAPRWC